MYKNIFGKHRIEVRTISGKTTKINSNSQTAYEEATFWSVKALTI